MPLELLLFLVIGGIAAIALLLHLSGRSIPKVMTAAEARQAWLRQFPESRIAQLTLAQNGHAALIEEEDTPSDPGLVWSFGADTVARSLQGAQLSKTKHGLYLQLADFSAPQVRLHLTAAESESWQNIITAAAHLPAKEA